MDEIKYAKELIKKFSIFVADANNTIFFATKAAIVHCEILLTYLKEHKEDENFLKSVKDYLVKSFK